MSVFHRIPEWLPEITFGELRPDLHCSLLVSVLSEGSPSQIPGLKNNSQEAESSLFLAFHPL
jgi:hypothetical protein